MLGYHQSSQWQQVYASDSSHGLAVIVHDATGAPRMTGRFGDTPSTGGAGTMYSFAYPGSLLQPNTSTAPTTVSLVAHAGGWRDGAAFYREWLRSVGTEQHKASWCEAASLLLCA